MLKAPSNRELRCRHAAQEPQEERSRKGLMQRKRHFLFLQLWINFVALWPISTICAAIRCPSDTLRSISCRTPLPARKHDMNARPSSRLRPSSSAIPPNKFRPPACFQHLYPLPPPP